MHTFKLALSFGEDEGRVIHYPKGSIGLGCTKIAEVSWWDGNPRLNTQKLYDLFERRRRYFLAGPWEQHKEAKLDIYVYSFPRERYSELDPWGTGRYKKRYIDKKGGHIGDKDLYKSDGQELITYIYQVYIDMLKAYFNTYIREGRVKILSFDIEECSKLFFGKEKWGKDDLTRKQGALARDKILTWLDLGQHCESKMCFYEAEMEAIMLMHCSKYMEGKKVDI